MGEIAAFNGLPPVSSDQVVDPDADSDLEEDVSSIATGSATGAARRLDGPKPLTTKRGSSLGSSSSSKGVIPTIETLIAQQVAQQNEERLERRRREEERREERAHEARQTRRQNKQWMQLGLIAIGAVRASQGGEGNPDYMQQLVSSIARDDSNSDEDRPPKSKRGRI
jgi:hypothetical protein